MHKTVVYKLLMGPSSLEGDTWKTAKIINGDITWAVRWVDTGRRYVA